MGMIACMLIPSGSYKYCSWESRWLLTCGWRVPSQARIICRKGSYENRIRVEIGAKNKQMEVEQREKWWLTRLHARHTCSGGFLRAGIHAQFLEQSRVRGTWSEWFTNEAVRRSQVGSSRVSRDSRAWCMSVIGWGRASPVGDCHVSITDSFLDVSLFRVFNLFSSNFFNL